MQHQSYAKYHAIINALPIGIIMLMAALLRFWQAAQIPFTHDEYSSLNRASYPTFSDMIQQGVITDTHPPLSQIIYYALLKTGGHSELWIKAPYLLMGLASVWLIYLLGKAWFTETTALLAASFFAVLQECVMHSQTARPYSLGGFFILLSAWWLTCIFLNVKKTNFAHWILGGILLSLSALSHHFSMLLATLLFALFAWANWRKNWSMVTTIALVAILIYLPNLVVLKHQLAQGGIGTVVSAPTATFLLHYFHYIFHYSFTLIALVLLLVVACIVQRNTSVNNKNSIIALSLFLFSYALGHFYSTYVAPVMHHRVLYFSLPFLLLFLFSSVKELSIKWKIFYTFLILSIGSYTLIYQRLHYNIFYTSGYKGVWQASLAAQDPNKKSLNLLAYTPFILDQQRSQCGQELIVTNPDSTWQMKDFAQLIDTTTASEFNAAFTMQYYKPPIEILAMLAKKYGTISTHHNYFNAWYYRFTKSTSTSNNYRIIGSEESHLNISTELSIDSLTGAYTFLPQQEFGYKNSVSIPNSRISNTDWIVAHAEAECPNNSASKLVMVVKQGDQEIAYLNAAFDDFILPNKTKHDIYLALYTIDLLDQNQKYEIEAYIWNHGEQLKIHQLDYYVIDGNPMMYSLYEPVKKPDIKKLPKSE
jgi:4-amino-4-deoxy-L-arabinose transferase-like glycosyltransferase